MQVITVTTNPALDLTIRASNWQRGMVNRGKRLEVTPGGKGLSVAINLNNAGIDASATGWMGRFNDHYFTDAFRVNKVQDDFIRYDGNVRQCIKIVDDDNGETTDINMPGKPVPQEAHFAMQDYLDENVNEEIILMFGGSLPTATPTDYYARMVKRYHGKCRYLVVDTSGEALKAVMSGQLLPDIIKPNIDEFRQLCGEQLQTDSQIIEKAREFIAKGMKMVIVSMGAQGAWFVSAEKALHAKPPEVKVVSTVGAGDAMVAGIIRGLILGRDLADMAKRATSFSAANIQHLGVYLLDGRSVDELKDQVIISEEGQRN